MRIRLAASDDVDALVALEEVCEGADAWSRALVNEGVAGTLPTTTWLVAEQPAAPGDSARSAGHAPICGYAVVAVVDDVAELQRIGVDPATRRTGVASALLAEVVAHARRLGVARLLLEVREDNVAARALYAGAGFAEISRRRRYYADGSTAVVMEQRL